MHKKQKLMVTDKKEIISVKTYSKEDARKFITKSLTTITDPQYNLKNFANKHLDKALSGRISKEQQVELLEDAGKLCHALGVETGYPLMESVQEINHGLAIEIKRNLEKEFDCQNYSEKMLVDLITNAYITKLSLSYKMATSQNNLGHDHDSYRNYLSKELDRSHRQFLSGLETLKFMKQPSLRVNIKTNTAFIAENQQFNNKSQNNESK